MYKYSQITLRLDANPMEAHCMVRIRAKQVLQHLPDSCPQPRPIQSLLPLPVDVGPLDGRHSGADQTVSTLDILRQVIQARSPKHRACDDALVDMGE